MMGERQKPFAIVQTREIVNQRQVLQLRICQGKFLSLLREFFLGELAGSNIAFQQLLGSLQFSRSLRDQILKTRRSPAFSYHPAVLTTADGERLEGLIRNEDNFSIQLVERDGRFRLLDKPRIASLTRLEKESLMPSGIARELSAEELQNLLAFLDRQRSAEEPASEDR